MLPRVLCAFATSISLLAGECLASDTITYTYDDLGRLRRSTYSTGLTVTFVYDAADNRTRAVVTTGPNQAPTATTDSVTALAIHPSGTPIKPSITFDPRGNDTDADADTLTITGVTSGSKGGVVLNSNGTVTWTKTTAVNGTYNNSDSFTYTLSDGQGHTVTGTVNVEIVVEVT